MSNESKRVSEVISSAICGLNVHHRWSRVKAYFTKKDEYRTVWKCSRCRQRLTTGGIRPPEYDGTRDAGVHEWD